jgi:hypothetical protein
LKQQYGLFELRSVGLVFERCKPVHPLDLGALRLTILNGD